MPFQNLEHDISGYRLVVCSNSIRNSVKVMLDKASLLNYMEFFLSNQDVSNGKPDPEMYNNAIARLGLSPQECMIVEDNEHGIAAAKASGAHVMEVETVEDVNYMNIRKYINGFLNKLYESIDTHSWKESFF